MASLRGTPRSTSYYRANKDDPEFLRRRRDYARRRRELAHEDRDRGKQVGCALCGEREHACLDLFLLSPSSDNEICLCANCHRLYRAGRVGLPHWVPERFRWRLSGLARRRRKVLPL